MDDPADAEEDGIDVLVGCGVVPGGKESGPRDIVLRRDTLHLDDNLIFTYRLNSGFLGDLGRMLSASGYIQGNRRPLPRQIEFEPRFTENTTGT